MAMAGIESELGFGFNGLVGWLDSKSFELRGQKQPTDSVKHVCSMVPSRNTPFCPTDFKAITPCDH